MLEIGFPELLLLATLALVVLGPARLPEVMRAIGGWYGRLRAYANAFRLELEQELDAREIKKAFAEGQRAVRDAQETIQSPDLSQMEHQSSDKPPPSA